MSVVIFTHEYRRYGYITGTTTGSQLTENKLLLFAFPNDNNSEAVLSSHTLYSGNYFWLVKNVV